MNRTLPPPGSLMAGIARLAFFNASGFAVIGHTTQAFLASLAPLVAFALVDSGYAAMTGGWRLGTANALLTACLLLGHPVLSHLVAKWFKREALWLRYATAMNWCQLVILAVLFVMTGLLTGAIGISPQGALDGGVMQVVLVYAVTLQTFLAWRGLNLSLGRAVAFVVVVLVGMLVLLAVPIGASMALRPGITPASLST